MKFFFWGGGLIAKNKFFLEGGVKNFRVEGVEKFSGGGVEKFPRGLINFRGAINFWGR